MGHHFSPVSSRNNLINWHWINIFEIYVKVEYQTKKQSLKFHFTPMSGSKMPNQISRNWYILNWFLEIFLDDKFPESNSNNKWNYQKSFLRINGWFIPYLSPKQRNCAVCILRSIFDSFFWNFWVMIG